MIRESFRDTFEFMEDRSQARPRFGGDERDDKEARKSDLIDLDLPYCGTRAASLVVHKPGDPNKKWIFLARKLIEFEMTSQFTVHVTLPSWLARDKGLV